MFFVRINSCQKQTLTRLCVIKCNKQKFFTFRFSLFTFCCIFAHRNATNDADMTVRREKAKPQKPPTKKLQEAEEVEHKPIVDYRREKLANYLIDVSKYILTGVVITSLFNDVSNKVIIYLIGLAAVFSTLILGLSLTTKRKDTWYGNVFSWTLCSRALRIGYYLSLYPQG